MSTPPPSASTTSFLLDNRSKCSDPCSPIRALELTRLLLGQFRKGEANDPEIWIRSMVLGRVDEFWRNDVFGIPELNQT
jgi:hypothetical protein